MSQIVVFGPKLRSSGWFIERQAPVVGRVDERERRILLVLLPVKPREKTPPVGASCEIDARASEESMVLTAAPTSCEVGGCSEWEREIEASSSGS
jgi:hypothetical protein